MEGWSLGRAASFRGPTNRFWHSVLQGSKSGKTYPRFTSNPLSEACWRSEWEECRELRQSEVNMRQSNKEWPELTCVCGVIYSNLGNSQAFLAGLLGSVVIFLLLWISSLFLKVNNLSHMTLTLDNLWESWVLSVLYIGVTHESKLEVTQASIQNKFLLLAGGWTETPNAACHSLTLLFVANPARSVQTAAFSITINVLFLGMESCLISVQGKSSLLWFLRDVDLDLSWEEGVSSFVGSS